MNFKAISINVGKALLVNALFMFLSMMVSIFSDFDQAFAPLAISFLVTLIVGVFPFIFVTDSEETQLGEGYVTIVLSWFLSFLFGMLPYVLYGEEFTVLNAWFESVSGYTTTGSTILNEIESLPKSLLFWRSSTHFIGGLGVVVFLLLILPDTSPFKYKLSSLEISSMSKSNYRYRSGTISRVMLSVYIGMTVVETLLLWAAGMSLFDAVNHSFSTVATGGFSTKNTSLMYFDSVAIEIIITIFMALSAMHFGVTFAIFASRSLKPLKTPVTKYYFSVIFILTLFVMADLMIEGGYSSFGSAILDSVFQVVSFITTTGFGQADNSTWPFIANLLLIFAAFHCGCSGSTTGGIKSDRMLVAFKAVGNEFQRRLHPSSVLSLKVGGTFIKDEVISSVFLYIVLYIFILLFSFILVLLTGTDIDIAFSGTVASLGNVGPGLGAIGTMGNYSDLPALAKFIFSIDMFLGRVEIFPLFVVTSLIFNRK